MQPPTLLDQLAVLRDVIASLQARGVAPVHTHAHALYGPNVSLTPSDFRRLFAGREVRVQRYETFDDMAVEDGEVRYTTTEFYPSRRVPGTELVRLPEAA